MTKINFYPELLERMIDEGMVSVKKHPLVDLWIYNYTQKCQFEKCWNEVTLQCRGLILDSELNIVARPFEKFFNYEELDPKDIPNLPFEASDKCDGSLGILYWIDDVPYVATRGSFESEQAVHATELFQRVYYRFVDKSDFIPDTTYLFEIIYPENRIVVDYGDRDELVLLAIIDNETGLDLKLPRDDDNPYPFPIVKRYADKEYEDGYFESIQSLNWDDAEGFVIKFSNGFRVKVKFENYVRLHRIITNTSSRTVWEHLKSGLPIESLLENVPDEFHRWVQKTISILNDRFSEIEKTCKADFKIFPSRKECAEYYKTKNYPHILFLMLDGKDYSSEIWKLIEPKFEKAFGGDIDG